MSENPQEHEPAEVQVPTTDEVEAAKWYTIGFLIVLGVFSIGAIWIMIRLAMFFLKP
jgi:hypothetical protein